MERPLFIGLIRQTKNTLDSVKKITQLSRGKFSDKEFGEFYCRMMNREIETHDFVLNRFLDYIKVTTPFRKKGTVNHFIEEALKKQQVRLGEKKVKLFRHLEKDLPETIVPDEHLKFILNAVLEYVMVSMPSGGNIELFTRSLAHQQETLGKAMIEDERKHIEISVAFTGYKKSVEQQGQTPSKDEIASELVFQLADSVVKMNQGITRVEVDEISSKKSISLRFPAEKRKTFFYEPATNH